MSLIILYFYFISFSLFPRPSHILIGAAYFHEQQHGGHDVGRYPRDVGDGDDVGWGVEG